MSITLMKPVRVLAVGVVHAAMIFAVLPSVANAQANLDGKAGAALKGGDSGGGADKGDGAGGDGGANRVDGIVDAALKGDGGKANLVGNDDGAIKGDARNNLLGNTNLNTDTYADQRVDLNDPPLVVGDTKSITEVNSDLLPAKGEAKADGNAVAHGLVDEGLCVRRALNQNASSCGGADGGADNA